MIRPLYDRLIVQRMEGVDTTPGGIIIPDAAKEKAAEGKVLAVGEGRIMNDGSMRPLLVKVGDHIYFGKYAGTELKVRGETHLLLREDDVVAVD